MLAVPRLVHPKIIPVTNLFTTDNAEYELAVVHLAGSHCRSNHRSYESTQGHFRCMIHLDIGKLHAGKCCQHFL